MSPIERAVSIAGGRQALAEKAGVSKQAISFWLNEQRQISAEAAVKIEAATDGKVPRSEIRPDIFKVA